jgi:hypothetical protein
MRRKRRSRPIGRPPDAHAHRPEENAVPEPPCGAAPAHPGHRSDGQCRLDCGIPLHREHSGMAVRAHRALPAGPEGLRDRPVRGVPVPLQDRLVRRHRAHEPDLALPAARLLPAGSQGEGAQVLHADVLRDPHPVPRRESLLPLRRAAAVLLVAHGADHRWGHRYPGPAACLVPHRAEHPRSGRSASACCQSRRTSSAG